MRLAQDNSPPSASTTSVGLVDPLKLNEKGLPGLLENVNRTLLGLIGLVALIMFVYAGITLLTSAGDSGKVTKAKDTMLYAAIGLIVVFASYAIVNFVIRLVTSE